MHYINRYWGHQNVETVDQFESMAEARKMLTEYRMADPSAHHRISQRSTKQWREES